MFIGGIVLYTVNAGPDNIANQAKVTAAEYVSDEFSPRKLQTGWLIFRKRESGFPEAV